ncbi:major capsid family protein [Escherichia coli]|uniref:major capsid family protein n=1 Tax=Escherichia coli TaxID=562 RepID=UPI00191B4DF8|nr:major capsid family protein [Escherichia coli]CAD6037111.1 Uncharacterized protein conserved in bacteria (DUF2184) [Escherichia coli]CAD6099241.1 Uncharacterized protein conserved in bacteria (DUF2184) [Escherichia coli]CAD6176220.1 Uncharacterized protein conserved in bacteria (DUF2184) [Escherichia coli]
MSAFAPGITTVQPSMVLPEMVMQYSMASGAFDILSGGAPQTRLGSSDLVVYQKYLRATTQAHVGQSVPAQLPSASIVPSYDQMMTYRISTRSQYSHFDTEAASGWGYSLTNAMQLANRQGHAQQMRNMLLYGVKASNHEGVTNSPNATTVNLGSDSKGNSAYTTWEAGEMARFLLGVIASQKTKLLLLGQPLTIVILSPMRFMQAMQWTGIVELTSYQRPGGGTQTVGGLVTTIASDASGDSVIFCQDDTLIGKGAGGTDLIVITSPEIVIPEARQDINTNIFATLTPNQKAVNVMFCDMAAPTEIPTPIPDGGITTLYTMRSTPGWNFRSEGVTLLSAKYQ